ncbi:cupin domain-containing protein [Salinarimonas soli]|uniref:Cupin domain-containing protein n=1 Tax=Salinarimonas soli TaxID=1638099 RepID=A0A5B2VZD0_9HYPH|nr:cupin domain-containing protein [Salinarimonas soli]KAA2244028.1 cupin domain-containing protein [Salinarimonas soli]
MTVPEGEGHKRQHTPAHENSRIPQAADAAGGGRAQTIGRSTEVNMKPALAPLLLGALAVPAHAQQGTARPDLPVLKEVTTEFPKDREIEARVLTATVQPGTTSPWHTHSAPVVVYVLEGTFTLELKDREAVHRKAGEALLEPVNVAMRAANHGAVPAKVVIFQASPPHAAFLDPVK